MHQMGVLFELEDVQLLLGFLERRQRSVGLVISGLESLVKSREDECRLLDYLEKLTDSTYTVQVLLASDQVFKETRAGMITYEVDRFEDKESSEWIKQSLKKHIKNDGSMKAFLTVVKGHPLCLDLACSLVRLGEVTMQDLVQRLQDESLLGKLKEQLPSDVKEEQKSLIM